MLKMLFCMALHTLINLAAGIGMGFCVISASLEKEWLYLLGALVCLVISTTSGYVVGAAFGRRYE